MRGAPRSLLMLLLVLGSLLTWRGLAAAPTDVPALASLDGDLHVLGEPTMDALLVAAGRPARGDLRILPNGAVVRSTAEGLVVAPPTDPLLFGEPVDPNLAPEAVLAALPGVGPRRASRIVEERLRAPFRSIDDLVRVSGIGTSTVDRLREHLSIGSVPPLDIDRSSAADLQHLPGIGPALAGRIVADREVNGPFGTPAALIRVPGIGPRTVDRITRALR